MVSFRRLPLTRTRNTRKENLFLSGVRFAVPMEAIFGPIMKHKLVEVMPTMPDYLIIPNCTFVPL
uniref:Protein yippee-like n=1 Tax=Rhizophora mucronata TaxID=61149 RepID=A0A2P2K2G2_RHIMU